MNHQFEEYYSRFDLTLKEDQRLLNVGEYCSSMPPLNGNNIVSNLKVFESEASSVGDKFTEATSGSIKVTARVLTSDSQIKTVIFVMSLFADSYQNSPNQYLLKSPLEAAFMDVLCDTSASNKLKVYQSFNYSN